MSPTCTSLKIMHLGLTLVNRMRTSGQACDSASVGMRVSISEIDVSASSQKREDRILCLERELELKFLLLSRFSGRVCLQLIYVRKK